MNKENSKHLPLNFLFPNIVTIIGLCFGMSAIKYSFDGRWELAVGLLVISAFIDGMDGRLARLLNASTKFGAELDSLTDFINFGVAPALILYSWCLNDIPVRGLGWAVSLIYCISCAFRLARFNTISKQTDHKEDNYFLGIPAPCGAGLTLVPIMLSFDLEISIFKLFPYYLAIYLLIIGLLMASPIPTFSLKKTQINRNYLLPILFLITIFIVALVLEPWFTLPIMGVIYLSLIPISVIKYYSKKR